MFLVSSYSKVRFLNGTVAFCTTNSSVSQGKTIDSPNVLLVRRGQYGKCWAQLCPVPSTAEKTALYLTVRVCL